MMALRPFLRVFSACLLSASALVTMNSAQAADMNKTLRVLFPNSEGTFDPILASEANTQSVIENIFDPLLRYNYLARPARLEGNTAIDMPTVSADGLTYTFKIKPGIYFSDDPIFKGQKRELTAADYVYSFKRLYDPVKKSPWAFVFDDTLLGDEAFKNSKTGKFDYSIEIAGLQALDRYTLQLKLKQPNINFPYLLAMPSTSAVAREVIEANSDSGAHPIGTGPYLLKEWQRSNRILLAANPNYRKHSYTFKAGETLLDGKIAEQLKDKQLPLIGQIEIKIVEEHQTRVLGFFGKQFDLIEEVPQQLTHMVVSSGKLRPELAKQGIALTLFPRMQVDYMWMNMQDPVVGGYTPEKIALRRAIAMSYNRDEDIRVHHQSLALPAVGVIPPSVAGYDAKMPDYVRHDVKMARALLDKYGYTDRDGDGYREMPDGKPLQLVMHSRANALGRVYDQRWYKSMESIGVRLTIKSDKYTEIIKASSLGQVQMFEFGWVADFPDASNFFQLLHNKSIGASNHSRFDLPQFNQLFEQSMKLQDSAERTELYRKLNQLIVGYAPWVLRVFPVTVDVRHQWVKNYLRHPVDNTAWRYLDIDSAARDAARK